MKHTLFFLIIGLSTTTYLNLRIPLTRDHSGNLYADAFNLSANTSARVSVLFGDFLYPDSVSFPPGFDDFFEFEGTLADSSQMIFRMPSSRLHFVQLEPSLLIGSVTALTQGVRSVAMTQHEGTSWLVFGSTMERFTESCVSDSIVHFQLNQELSLSNGVFSIAGTEFRFRTFGFLGDPDFVLVVPEGVVAGINASLISLGAIPDTNTSSRSTRFGNCSSEVASRLPDISLTVSNATLVFYPDDYMRFHDDGVCELLLRISFDGIHSYMSPAILTGFNFIVSRDQTWVFCDPA